MHIFLIPLASVFSAIGEIPPGVNSITYWQVFANLIDMSFTGDLSQTTTLRVSCDDTTGTTPPQTGSTPTELYDMREGTTVGGLNSNIRGMGNEIQASHPLIGKTITKLGFEFKTPVSGTITLGVFSQNSPTPLFVFGTIDATTLTNSFVLYEKENTTGHVLEEGQILGWYIDGTNLINNHRYNSGTGADPNIVAKYWAFSSAPNWQVSGNHQDQNMRVEGY